MEHIKKTKVNVIGAFILANDVNRLQVRRNKAVLDPLPVGPTPTDLAWTTGYVWKMTG